MRHKTILFIALLCAIVQGMMAETGVGTEEALTTAVATARLQV